MLKLYYIDMKYIRDLHHADNNVLSVSPQIDKAGRLFVGVIVVFDNKKYCIPLSSPKKKHENMGNRIDISRIYDRKGNLVGVLNYNSMIPVTENQIKEFNVGIKQSDNEHRKKYKKMCEQELRWIRKHSNDIESKAKNLYLMYIRGDKFNARERCVDFPKLEKICEKYNKKMAGEGRNETQSG